MANDTDLTTDLISVSLMPSRLKWWISGGFAGVLLLICVYLPTFWYIKSGLAIWIIGIFIYLLYEDRHQRQLIELQQKDQKYWYVVTACYDNSARKKRVPSQKRTLQMTTATCHKVQQLGAVMSFEFKADSVVIQKKKKTSKPVVYVIYQDQVSDDDWRKLNVYANFYKSKS